MRVVKDAEERRNEILDVAERLFCAKGFDNASTNDILKEIGIARGTLYYHFKSKEDILDLIERKKGKETEENEENKKVCSKITSFCCRLLFLNCLLVNPPRCIETFRCESGFLRQRQRAGVPWR